MFPGSTKSDRVSWLTMCNRVSWFNNTRQSFLVQFNNTWQGFLVNNTWQSFLVNHRWQSFLVQFSNTLQGFLVQLNNTWQFPGSVQQHAKELPVQFNNTWQSFLFSLIADSSFLVQSDNQFVSTWISTSRQLRWFSTKSHIQNSFTPVQTTSHYIRQVCLIHCYNVKTTH